MLISKEGPDLFSEGWCWVHSKHCNKSVNRTINSKWKMDGYFLQPLNNHLFLRWPGIWEVICIMYCYTFVTLDRIELDWIGDGLAKKTKGMESLQFGAGLSRIGTRVPNLRVSQLLQLKYISKLVRKNTPKRRVSRFQQQGPNKKYSIVYISKCYIIYGYNYIAIDHIVDFGPFFISFLVEIQERE